MIVSIDAENTSDKIQQAFMMKKQNKTNTSQWTKYKGELP